MFRPFQAGRGEESEHAGAAGGEGTFSDGGEVLPTLERDKLARGVETGGRPGEDVGVQPFYEDEFEDVRRQGANRGFRRPAPGCGM